MPAVIFSGAKVKTLKKSLELFGGVQLISSTIVPTVTAVDAPAGSLLFNETSGDVYRKLDAGSTTNWSALGSGGGGSSVVRFILEGAVVHYVSINGTHYQTTSETLSTVLISALGTGTSGSTTIQVNQYRAGALQASATASLAANAGLPGGVQVALSAPLVLISGDILTVDVNSVASGASDLSVEWSSAGSAGGSLLSVATKTVSYVVTNSDDVILVNSASPVTITMQSVASATTKAYNIKNIGSGTLTIVPAGADTVDGDTSVILPGGGTPQAAVSLIPDGGSAWSIF